MRPHAPPTDVGGDPWDVVDRLLDDVDRRARSAAPPAEFWRSVLDEAIDAFAACGGIAWHVEPDGRTLHPWAVVGLPATPWSPAGVQGRAALAAAVAKHRRSAVVLPQASASFDPTAGNPTDDILLVVPVVVDDAAVAVLEIAARADVPPDARDGALRVLETLAASAADYHRERQRQALAIENAALRRLDDFASAVHRADDLPSFAYALANEGRRQLACDRLSVVVVAEGRVAASAVSGVDAVDRTAPTVQALERAALQPASERAGDDYRAVAQARDVRLVPLRTTPDAAPAADVCALLVAENFVAPLPEDFDARLEPLRRHGAAALQTAAALARAATWERRILARARRAVGRVGKRPLVCAAVAALLVAPWLLPAELTVEARGRLQPRERRDLYAPLDGIVQEVRVAHGDPVTPDQVLVVLRSPELEVELSRVLGEIETARSRLSALRSLRTSAAGPTPTGAARQQEWTAEEEQLRQTLAAREEELALLHRRRAELQVRAPIRGRVLAWNVEQRLVGRPVARGQLLLHVADTAGPWVVELDVPQRRAADVLEARAAQSEPLAATFVTAVDAQRRRPARLASVAHGVEVNEAGEVVVPAVLDVVDVQDAANAADDDATQIPGAAVTAVIVCRRTTLGLVWWRELIRFVYDRRL